MSPDPAVRRDGRCACGCGKTRPILTRDVKLQRRLRRYAGGQAESDPFATSRCARRFHGCELASDAGVDDAVLDARTEAGRQGRENFQRGQAAFGDPVLA